MVFAYVPDVVSKMDGLIGRSFHNHPVSLTIIILKFPEKSSVYIL
jgi:hypothetical protein